MSQECRPACCSATNSDPAVSSHFNLLPRRSARNPRAEQHPNREEAEDAAWEACARESHRGGCNDLQSVGMNSCFFIIGVTLTYPDWPETHTLFTASKSEGYPSRAAAEAAAKRIAADNSYTNEFGTIYKASVELVECGGVE